MESCGSASQQGPIRYEEAPLIAAQFQARAPQGKGIFLVRDLQQVTDRLESDQRRCKIASRPTARIAQRYITPPLLLGGRKFDIRVYLLVVAARQYVVLYADGYVRLSCASYNAASSDLTVHLTNQYQQKKHPDYSSMRDDTVSPSLSSSSLSMSPRPGVGLPKAARAAEQGTWAGL